MQPTTARTTTTIRMPVATHHASSPYMDRLLHHLVHPHCILMRNVVILRSSPTWDSPSFRQAIPCWSPDHAGLTYCDVSGVIEAGRDWFFHAFAPIEKILFTPVHCVVGFGFRGFTGCNLVVLRWSAISSHPGTTVKTPGFAVVRAPLFIVTRPSPTARLQHLPTCSRSMPVSSAMRLPVIGPDSRILQIARMCSPTRRAIN